MIGYLLLLFLLRTSYFLSFQTILCTKNRMKNYKTNNRVTDLLYVQKSVVMGGISSKILGTSVLTPDFVVSNSIKRPTDCSVPETIPK